ncbi:uncharacterized protein LOC108165519 [Drosophila miranda]|uniref:uncharacterized protein LOC108165519 n=1 Tax=Drosophila miranda TaxID=7229 RepID=UPI0007E8506C|nr:uncharacterized protein LOC108165519 [Drosophila miranda]
MYAKFGKIRVDGLDSDFMHDLYGAYCDHLNGKPKHRILQGKAKMCVTFGTIITIYEVGPADVMKFYISFLKESSKIEAVQEPEYMAEPKAVQEPEYMAEPKAVLMPDAAEPEIDDIAVVDAAEQEIDDMAVQDAAELEIDDMVVQDAAELEIDDMVVQDAAELEIDEQQETDEESLTHVDKKDREAARSC